MTSYSGKGAVTPTGRRRLVRKGGSGRVNVKLEGTRSGFASFREFLISDIFTGAVDMSWRYTLLLFAASFLLTWLLFALLWWLLLLSHGDFEVENLPDGANQVNGSFTPCVSQIYSFASCYLFSVETQHTIGYGSRQTTEACPLAIALMSLQSIVGVLSTSCVAGIVFAKLARPKNRVHTVAFSKNALVQRVEDSLFLVIRVANLRKSHLIEAHVRVVMYRDRSAKQEGALEATELKVSTSVEGDDDRALMLLPVSVYHQIDRESPFYELTRSELARMSFELVVTLEGVVEPSGNSVQARTSYLPHEVLWGYRFRNMTSSSESGYVADISRLNLVEEEDGEYEPEISAKMLRERKCDGNCKREKTDVNSNEEDSWTSRLGRDNPSFSPA